MSRVPSRANYGSSPKVQVIDKGNILSEINRLKNLERHHQRINEIARKPSGYTSLKKYNSTESLHRRPEIGSRGGSQQQFPLKKQNFRKECNN